MLKSGQIVFRKNILKKNSALNNPQSEKTSEEQKTIIITEKTQVLVRATPVRLFDLAPDEITVDINRVNFINREFLGGTYVKSILISEITDVIIESAALATLKIVEAHNKEVSSISQLKYEDADKVRNIIQGIIIASKNKIDLTKIPQEKLPDELDKLGQGAF